MTGIEGIQIPCLEMTECVSRVKGEDQRDAVRRIQAMDKGKSRLGREEELEQKRAGNNRTARWCHCSDTVDHPVGYIKPEFIVVP